jgi:regulator of RNase E activity RraA
MPVPEVPVPVPPTATVADAAVRLGVPVAVAPPALVPLLPGAHFAGPAVPVTHLGSVDVFLEAIDDAPPGAVLVVDNGGRQDEACVGDLVVLEAAAAGFAAVVVWGLHRDTAELRRIGLPVHSLGAHPFGPRRVPPAGPIMRVAFLDGVPVTADRVLVGDDDGVLVLAATEQDRLFALALEIQATEERQARRMTAGESLRAQLDFDTYRRTQAADPSMTLRKHLAQQGGAIET